MSNPRADVDQKWAAMIERHDAFSAEHPEIAGGSPAHHPEVAFLACADARVSPALLFDQGHHTAFVVRVAGNTATASATASLAYAVDALGVDLIVVLGHSQCGAVTAAFQGVSAPSLSAVLNPIDESLDASGPCADVDEAIAANVHHNMIRLRRDHGALGIAVAEGRVAIRGAIHDITDGRLHVVEDVDGAPHVRTSA